MGGPGGGRGVEYRVRVGLEVRQLDSPEAEGSSSRKWSQRG